MSDAGMLAARLLQAHDRGSLTRLPSAGDAAFDMRAAFAVADALRRLRSARGEKAMGWKIGFTNRSIWQRYGVHRPIWGPVWDSGTALLDGATASVSLAGLSQPRLEPEVVFGVKRTPRAGMSLTELQGCLDWVAHGFEIVHTHFDGWRFGAADSVADFALHGRLRIGPRVSVQGWHALAEDLSALQVELLCDGQPVDRGQGAVVLDGPLHALRLWVDEMAEYTPAWTIRVGDVVTTGTITDAWPLQAGQCWQTRLSDARLTPLTLNTQA
ncbi:MAG TPA: hydratase [Rubrivivax sp.]|nr:hydratase [Rubrivivax sp.]